jgi:kumamolisin
MKDARKIPILLTACLIAFGASAQESKAPGEPPPSVPTEPPPGIVTRPGTVVTPPVSVPSPGKVHTNYKIFVPAGGQSPAAKPEITDAEYPASIGCVYRVGPVYAGCVPANNGDHPTGGWGAIAVVDAYDDPNAASDLAFFSSFFGLPAATFIKRIANTSYGTLNGLTASCSGTPPNANLSGWDTEEALDIEWAHTMAPAATIALVEACSNSLNDLLFAEEVAGIVVSNHGGGDISNSWGVSETAGETADDNYFYRYYWKNITYFASAGDVGSEVIYPSSSPWVVSAGGTTINRDASANFLSESCWSDSGGGSSTVEQYQNPPNIMTGMGPWTNYQYGLFGGAPYVTPYRSTPDMSFDSDPASGVWVRNTDATGGGGWYVVGGTSLAAPALAGLVNASGNKLGQVGPGLWYQPSELNLLYSQLGAASMYAGNFYDVTTGTNGHTVGTGYDQCTGIGSPRGRGGK